MQFVYPIDLEVNSDNEDVKHLKGASNTAGYFPIGRLNTWHGGIHFEGNMAIKAIADGRIIAYRVPQEYSEQVIDSSVGKYSNGFVLIVHDTVTPEGKSLEFFSLYNHLIPFSEMKDDFVPDIFNTPNHIIKKNAKDKGSAKGLNLHSSAKYSDQIVAAKGTKLTIDTALTAEEQDSKHWTHKKSGTFKKVKYTSPNGKQYNNYFICTTQKTTFVNKKKVLVDRVKEIGGNKLEVVIEEDNGWNGDIGGRETKKPGDKNVLRIIPREQEINIDEKDNGGTNGWVRIINEDGSKGGYIYYNDSVAEKKNCNLNKDEDCDKVNNVNIKISAGTVIGFAGMYGVEKREYYRSAHVEVFTSEDPEDFLNNQIDGQNALNYFKILKDTTLSNSLPYLLLNQSRIKVHDTKGDYTKIEVLDIEKEVADRDTYLGSYNKTNKTYTFGQDHTDRLNNSNALFGNHLQIGNSLKLLDSDDEIEEKNNQTPKDKSRRVRFEYSLHGQKFWIPSSSIAEEEQEEENTTANSIPAQNTLNNNTPAPNNAESSAETNSERSSSGASSTEESTNQSANTSEDEDTRELSSSVSELFIEHPDDFEEIKIDIDSIVNLSKHKKYSNQDNEIRYYINHKDYNSLGIEDTYKGIIGPISDNDVFSAYNWTEFGFEKYDDGNYDDYIYDPQNNEGLAKEIANTSFKYVDKNNKEHSKLIDADGDGVLEPHELQRALQRPHIANRLSHMVVKHTSEWAYQDGLRDNLLDQVKTIYEEGIKNESDSTRKQELDDLKEKRLDALKAKMENLCFWKNITIPAAEEEPEPEPEAATSESEIDSLRMQIEQDLVIEQDNTSYVIPYEETTLVRTLPQQVWHFHPVAFVEQMRKVCYNPDHGIIHDIIINPQVRGWYNPSAAHLEYAKVKGWNVYASLRLNDSKTKGERLPRASINRSSHSGLDIYAPIGTPVYAMTDGTVNTSFSESIAGNKARLTIKSITLNGVTIGSVEHLHLMQFESERFRMYSRYNFGDTSTQYNECKINGEFNIGWIKYSDIPSSGKVLIDNVHNEKYKVKYSNGILIIDDNQIDPSKICTGKVKKGDLIGYSGGTGNSFQGKKFNHVHCQMGGKDEATFFGDYLNIDIVGDSNTLQDGTTRSENW